MNKLYLIIVFLCCSFLVMGQGQIKRPQKTIKPIVEISQSDGYINGHGYVDLGLPSATKWAICNVGADSPSGHGHYYAWGETRPKSEYSLHNLFDFLGNSSGGSDLDIYKRSLKDEYWEFYKNEQGKKQIHPLSGHDTANENWGSNWRLPTEEEFRELLTECKWTEISDKGWKGYKVSGPNGKCIFLPASGFRNGSELYHLGERGEYMSYTLRTSGAACYLILWDGRTLLGHGGREVGRSVRPVTQ